MNIALWIVSGVLALLNLGAGGAKLMTPKPKLVENPRMAWANDFSANAIKGIGAAEVLGAIGLIVPWLSHIAMVLTPLAAVGLVALQVGAAITHFRRGERQVIPMNIVLVVLAAVVAVGRFVQLSS